MKTFIVKSREKLSEFLIRSYRGGLSYGRFSSLLKNKDVKINGKRVNKDCFLSENDVVDCYFDCNIEKPYSVVFKDDNILAVYKKKGVFSEELYEELKSDFEKVYFCHRLDANTDGLMFFALNEQSYSSLVAGFKNRTFEKYYLAKVNGVFARKEATLTAYLLKDEKSSRVKIFSKPVEGSLKIITAYRVVKEKDDCSTIKVELLTGRTHQIRAHLAFIGHFVLGDGKYGDDRVNKEKKCDKLMLTSYKTILHFEKDDFLYYLDGKAFLVSDDLIADYLR